MKLSETTWMMNSDNWRDRFVAEYVQLMVRYNKLDETIRKLKRDDYELPLLTAQHAAMFEYLCILKARACLAGIDLPEIQAEQAEHARTLY